MNFIEFDPNLGLVMNLKIDSIPNINARMKTVHQRRHRIAFLKNFCLFPPINEFVTIERKHNYFTIRIERALANNYVTIFRKQYHKSELGLTLSLLDYELLNFERDIVARLLCLKCANDIFYAQIVLNFDQIKRYILERNSEMCKEVIKESMHPNRIQKMFDLGMDDIGELFIV